jgi:tetratricopeptide (TPR) repeat protein
MRIIVWAVTLGGAAFVLAAGPLVFRALRRDPPQRLLRDARRALQVGAFARAEQIATQIPTDSREYSDGLLVAGESATRQNRLDQAIAYYAKIPPDSSDQSVTGMYCTADLLFQLGKLREAERQYRKVLAVRPSDVWTHQQLASFLLTFGRRWEAVPSLFALAQMEQISVDQLLHLGQPEAPLDLTAGLSKLHAAPNDPLTLIGHARSAWDAHDRAQAEHFARQAVDADPGQIEAWAILGRALLHHPDGDSDLLKWHLLVPESAEAHPDVWLTRGIWAEEHNQAEVAIRCFWEALRRDPDLQVANYHLAQALLKLDPPQTGRAAPFLERAERLEEFREETILIYQEKTNLRHIRRAAELTETLGRLWESAAWCRLALEQQPRLDWAGRQFQRLASRLSPGMPRVLADSNPAGQIDLSSYALPDLRSNADLAAAARISSARAGLVRFEDSAAAAGIDFRYFNGAEPATDGKMIYQTLGGGVAALDYDGDLRPDLYFCQGAPAPDDNERHTYRDRLYRNRGDGRFDDVTFLAGLGDGRHTLGIAAGDLDDDGFADLYLANAGLNRLYRNNGDGTFSDTTAAAGLVSRRCTASCLIADLNGDSFPELYDVNYLAEPGVYTLTCPRNGRDLTCGPRGFAAAQDQLFLNLGDGRYDEITHDCGIELPNGKGLGIVAADFAGNGFLNLFIANDDTPNFYFINQTPRRGDRPLFRDAALAAGLALSEDGKAQASMGIAIDDADGDGLLDLFVTNFYEEPDAFYRQITPDVFEDANRRFGLREATLFQLGFGTQFIDGDLDGFPDLIVTNGHIEDYSSEGQPFRMHPQYFRNVSGQRFEEVSSDSLGTFFAGKYLGRGLARIDWNCDGKEDVVISHLDSPAALLTNSTPNAGHFFALRLAGTRSSRDAVGTTVRCEAGGRVRIRQLTAGDGYMASNERQLIFGLGAAERVDRLTIQWPSGIEERFTGIAGDGHWLAIEGQISLRRLPVPAKADFD